MRTAISRTAAPVILVILLAACAAGAGTTAPPPGTDTPTATPSPGSSEPPITVTADGILTIEPGSAGGPGISIEEAIAQAGIGPLLVNGALFIGADEVALLCSAIAESYPPQCGGTRLEVRGLDPDSIPDLEAVNGVRWVEQIQLFGTVALIET